MTSVHSSDLVWQLVRGHHSSLVTRGIHTFSSEKGNLRRQNTPIQSGFAHKAVVIEADPKGVRVGVKSTRPGRLARPVSTTKTTVISSDIRSGAAAVRNIVSAYSPKLTNDAVARYAAIKRASLRKPVAPALKPKRQHRHYIKVKKSQKKQE